MEAVQLVAYMRPQLRHFLTVCSLGSLGPFFSRHFFKSRLVTSQDLKYFVNFMICGFAVPPLGVEDDMCGSEAGVGGFVSRAGLLFAIFKFIKLD